MRTNNQCFTVAYTRYDNKYRTLRSLAGTTAGTIFYLVATR